MSTSVAKKPRPQGAKSLLAAVIAFAVLASLGVLYWIRANVAPPLSVPPPPPMPTRNGFDSFNAAARAETQKNVINIVGPSSPYTLAQSAAAIQANAPALRLLRQGLTLPYQNPAFRSFNTRFPYYADFRALARLLSSEGQVREAQGDWAGALSSDLDSIQLGEEITRGGPATGDLVGMACQAIGRKPAWPRVDHLNAVQARADARRLEQISRSHVPLTDVLQEEEWATQASLLEVMDRPTWRSDLWQQMSISDYAFVGNASLIHAEISLRGKAAILDRYTAAMDRCERDARRPYAALSREAQFDPIAQAVVAFCDDIRFRDAYTQTENALLLVSLALRAYRLEHGAYPATLSALVPAYLVRVPDDPFAPSGPLRYMPQGVTCLLYSIGPDGLDDGGRPIMPGANQSHFVQADSKGDIVAGVNIQ